jgi:hypothetical protein
MSELEVINILIGCKPVIARLAAAGPEVAPNQTEQATLEGFGRIRKAGFSYDKLKLLAQRAGLNPSDLGVLNWYALQSSLDNTSASPSSYR